MQSQNAGTRVTFLRLMPPAPPQIRLHVGDALAPHCSGLSHVIIAVPDEAAPARHQAALVPRSCRSADAAFQLFEQPDPPPAFRSR